MKLAPRITLALLAGICALAEIGPGSAQGRTELTSERDKVSYMVGMDVGKSLAAVGSDMDLTAFQRAIANTFKDGKPLIAESDIQPLAQALMQRIAARSGQSPGTRVPEVDRNQVGYLLGADVGRSLAPIQDELDLKILVQAVGDRLVRRRPLLAESEAEAMHPAFQQQMRAKQLRLAEKNRAKSAAFLIGNKQAKGVSVTSAGLQYMVLRQGAGHRPVGGEQVRFNYRARLLDGTLYESTYDRHHPIDLVLDPSGSGWTQALSLMPVGGKYRFWMPVEQAYGAQGTPGVPIGPKTTLVFDVELMSIDR